MKHFTFLLYFFLLEIPFVFSQEKSYEINNTIVNSIPENVTIVGLGDPTHQESTITKYRIDLIKKMVKEKEFKVIAIEGNMYEFYKAHQLFIKDKDISHYEKAMYRMLNAKEMEELYSFIYTENKKGNELQFIGFDPAFSGVSFAQNIAEDLEGITSLSQEEKDDFIKYIKKANIVSLKALFRNNKKVKEKIVFYSEKILATFNPKTQNDYFFSEALKNMIFLFTNDPEIVTYGANKRDIGMALNVDFIQSQFPNEKIILFGSSTHLLKNPNAIEGAFFQNNRITFGHKLSEKFKSNYFYIAYTALSGTKYNYLNKNKPKHIPEAAENSIEYKINQEFKAPAVYITKETDYPMDKVLASRFMGHSFLTLQLWEVMDALVLIKEVESFEIKKL
ncbi:erythromycin esterase family protein [Flavobacterium jejuense]|uniref:Erythromycin esterase family protein n=1 Tax=Flavobacterium jejuense TaxID=1544455 RepID=A0ABX0IVN2_9FLAO|nr:erythromycin esterase family protein [Flavobacterium jejuense]NHN27528.1 erythromycin esterase family protein [Flavobacterium jejuense]